MGHLLENKLTKGVLAGAIAALINACAHIEHQANEKNSQENTSIINNDSKPQLIIGVNYGNLFNRTLLHDIEALESSLLSTTTFTPEDDIQSAWDITRENLVLKASKDNKRIQHELSWLKKHPQHVTTVSNQALPYYHYILEQVLDRGMPAEIALIPFIESGYNPFVVSASRAAGPWQFIPGTANNFGLQRNSWYDARRDIIASTDAALNYLSYLNNMFNGDWLLTLAAYNAGEGNVMRSINHNRRANKPTDYWSLRLPGETMRYVPKILATAKAIRHADTYGFDLQDIPSEPYFAEIAISGQMDLAQVARIANVDLDEIKLLNAGFSQAKTAPQGPHRILVPADKAALFNSSANLTSNRKNSTYQRHIIVSGDTLSAIAKRFGTTVSTIKAANQMNSTRLQIGQTLLVPARNSEITMTTSRAASG